MFLGVSQESKAYRMYDPSSKKIVISRDVIFDEDSAWDWSKENQKTQILTVEDDEHVQENENIEEPQNPPNSTQNSDVEAGSPVQGMPQTENPHEDPNSPVSPTSGNS